MQLSVIQFTVKMFHIGFMQVLVLQWLISQYYKIFKILKLSYLQFKYRTTTTVPSTFRLYIQPPQHYSTINIQTVYTATTARQYHQHTDRIYSHHSTNYRSINIQAVYTATTALTTVASTYRLYLQPPQHDSTINIQTVYTATTARQ
jgi:hypothetical protein